MKCDNIKVVEIRDRATLIPALAIKMRASDAHELFLFMHAGYPICSEPCVLLISIEAPCHSARCSDEWGERSARTMTTAHKWIQNHFDEIKSGQVIDVEFILKEKEKPCLSFMFE